MSVISKLFVLLYYENQTRISKIYKRNLDKVSGFSVNRSKAIRENDAVKIYATGLQIC